MGLDSVHHHADGLICSEACGVLMNGEGGVEDNEVGLGVGGGGPIGMCANLVPSEPCPGAFHFLLINSSPPWTSFPKPPRQTGRCTRGPV